MKIPILLYHSIAEKASPAFQKWVVHPDLFRQHLAYLSEHGFSPLTVSDFIRQTQAERPRLPEKPVVITFDDGFEDFYTQALPALLQYHFSATLYMVSRYVGSTSRWLAAEGGAGRPMLNWQQLNLLTSQGIEIGAHSQSHPQLDTLPIDKAWEEILGARIDLEQRLGKRVTSFAYPHGYHSRQSKLLVQRAGYQSACGVKHAISALQDDRYSLARIIISAGIPLSTFADLLAGKGLRTAPTGELLTTWVWRQARRSHQAWLAAQSLDSIG